MNTHRLVLALLMVALTLSSPLIYRASNVLSQSGETPLIVSPGMDGVATVTADNIVHVRASPLVVEATTTFSDAIRLSSPRGYSNVIGIGNLNLNTQQILELQVFVTYSNQNIPLYHNQRGTVVLNNTFTLPSGTEAVMGLFIMPALTPAGSLDTISFQIVSSSEWIGLTVDVYTQKGGTGANVSSDSFSPFEEIKIIAYMTYGASPLAGVTVALQVIDPTGAPIAYRALVTNESGLAVMSFWLSQNYEFGAYTAVGTVTYLDWKVSDFVTFDFGWIVQVTQVTPCDVYGNPTLNFSKGASSAYFKLSVRNIALEPKYALVTVTAQDSEGFIIGVASLSGLLRPGTTPITLSMTIPMWAFSGRARVFGCAFTYWPHLGGVPYSPETSATFVIA